MTLFTDDEFDIDEQGSLHIRCSKKYIKRSPGSDVAKMSGQSHPELGWWMCEIHVVTSREEEWHRK